MFDVLEARMNCTAHKKLANALATIGANTVPVIFDAEYSAATVGGAHMGASTPQMQIMNSDVPADFSNSSIQITIGASAPVTWIVAERRPDGEQQAGITLVFLERP